MIANELQKDGKMCRHKGREHVFRPLKDPLWKNVLKCKYCNIYLAKGDEKRNSEKEKE